MVKLMLDGFGGDRRHTAERLLEVEMPGPDLREIRCYHVNTQFSSSIEDMGAARFGKILLVFRYCFEALWCRIRHGVKTFYFAPAPPKRPALYRDWIVMLICRPFFRHFVHHWHAAGTMDWLEQEGSAIDRCVTRLLLGKPALGIALATANLRDPLWLQSRHVEIVPNGIHDPLPAFTEKALPRRRARLTARKLALRSHGIPPEVASDAGADPTVFRLLYLGHCLREKGIFETVEGVARAHQGLKAQGSPITLHLTVAGDFASADDRTEFASRTAQPDLAGVVHYAGFVNGEEKARLLLESDCLCFPTYCDSFGLVVVEAMAFGLSVVATRWRALPEILPADYPGFVGIRDPAAIAECIPNLFEEDGTRLRTRFEERFTAAAHLQRLEAALLSLQMRPR